MTKALITGASGFAGSHLAECLHEKGNVEVYGTVYGNSPEINSIIPNDHQVQINLLDREEVFRIISTIQPDLIFHLAALSSPAASFNDPRGTFTNNVEAQINLLDGAKELTKLPRVLIVGSAEEYGSVTYEQLPMNESTPLNPVSPYAVSKVAQDYLGLMYGNAYQLPVIRVRPFNHIGERQTEAFVASAFAKQIASVEAGLQEPTIHVGNLTAKRDFTDVKDMVNAYYLALTQGVPGDVYNLGSGKSVAISELLNLLLSFSPNPIHISTDSTRVQKADIPELRCDYTKFHSITGWNPTIPLQDTAKRVLDYWRQKVTENSA